LRGCGRGRICGENPEEHSQTYAPVKDLAEKGPIAGEIPKNIPQGLKPCIDLIRLMRQLKLPHTLKTSFPQPVKPGLILLQLRRHSIALRAGC
jgi:hypothetical protein